MTQNKTQPTDESVLKYLNALSSDQQKQDAMELVELMRSTTGEPAVMWGPSIVGFGSYHYVYESGREGDSLRVGFAARKTSLVLYGLTTQDPHHPNAKLLKKLGRHKAGKGCIYIKKLDDVDVEILKSMIKNSFSD